MMPPRSDDLYPMKFAVRDENGNLIELGDKPITQYEGVPDCCGFEIPTFFRDREVSFTVSCRMRYARGGMDYLCGQYYTKAAWRFLRLAARHKEKERRKKLKEEKR